MREGINFNVHPIFYSFCGEGWLGADVVDRIKPFREREVKSLFFPYLENFFWDFI